MVALRRKEEETCAEEEVELFLFTAKEDQRFV